ncbi:response regulator transcription factor [Lysinibacter sp. HNR]|uniref:response regulator transcription factor n=1 Tax=Lysinibacter sp. HNR TaxID=3031408 RepID=UPI0024360FF1|nr:response regulator transcription factor [Lysinibacter sp. HNR]WGD37687.1 response regulator transcription factor [Lysinibacter sp. HNR]
MKILVADDDAAVRRSLTTALELERYEVCAVSDGRETLESLIHFDPDLFVVDWMMPNLDGVELCRVLRRMNDHTPLLILTARTRVSDRVVGLDSGADDYLIKPFDLSEFLARVRALVRRKSTAEAGTLRYADLTLDPASRTGRRGNREITFTHTEAALLERFILNSEQVLSRQQLEERVWGEDSQLTSNSLAVYINYLRKKITEENEVPLIHTERGFGYTLRTGSNG